jgi:serine/threonine protein kinase
MHVIGSQRRRKVPVDRAAVGTAGFMAPEAVAVYMGHTEKEKKPYNFPVGYPVGQPVDMYSLGAISYEIMSGRKWVIFPADLKPEQYTGYQVLPFQKRVSPLSNKPFLQPHASVLHIYNNLSNPRCI